MQKTFFFPLLILLAVLANSCQKDDLAGTDVFHLSKRAQSILLDCRANPLKTAEAIKLQLLGNWELIGYACSHCVPHSPPTASITFTGLGGHFEINGEFTNDSFDFAWELQDNGRGTFLLKTAPFHHGLIMTNFCKGYMSHDARPGDGAVFLYKKR